MASRIQRTTASLRLLVFLARKSLMSSRVTLVLLALAIAAGAGFQVANTSNLDGFGEALLEEGLTHGAGDIRVEPTSDARFRDGDAVAATLREYPGVTDAVPVLVFAGAVGAPGKRYLGAPIYGVPPAGTAMYIVNAGTNLVAGDRDGILLGTSIAKRLGAHVGDTVHVRVIFGAAGMAVDDDNVGRFTLTVRGIASGSSGAYRFAFVDRAFLAKASGEPTAASTILVHLGDHEAAAATAAKMTAEQRGLEAIGWREDDPYLPNYLGANQTIGSVSYAMVIAAVSVPMWALLYIHVLKRRREIGILSALGFGRGEVFVIFVLQALLVALIGSALGAMIGFGLIEYFQAHPLFEWETLVVRPVMAVRTFVGPAIVISVTAIVAGSYPAWRAARTDPAKVLRGLE